MKGGVYRMLTDERNYRCPCQQGTHTGKNRKDGNHQAGAGNAPCGAAGKRQAGGTQ